MMSSEEEEEQQEQEEEEEEEEDDDDDEKEESRQLSQDILSNFFSSFWSISPKMLAKKRFRTDRLISLFVIVDVLAVLRFFLRYHKEEGRHFCCLFFHLCSVSPKTLRRRKQKRMIDILLSVLSVLLLLLLLFCCNFP
jgi:hypothetical protein